MRVTAPSCSAEPTLAQHGWAKADVAASQLSRRLSGQQINMDYARYSKEALDALPPHSAELKRRIVELRTDVMLELHAAIAAKSRDIVNHLNALGHDLHEASRSRPGAVGYAQ